MKRFLLALFLSPLIAHAEPLPVLQGHKIVIDPGHGTLNYDGRIINAGKINRSGVQERRVAMSISQKLGEMLEKEGAIVYYTRTMKDFWRESASNAEDNKSRALVANSIGAQAYIAIHCDWDPRSRVHGVTTFYLQDISRELGNSIQTSMVKNLQVYNRKLVRDSYTVLDVATVPAVLIETGFLSNGTEARKLANKKYQEKVAAAIARGVKNYFAKMGVISTP
jgi:N-acetylmuramoyl-L-alanine amidase